MARDFVKNTSNRMSLGVGAIGTLLNGASKIAVHALINPDAFDTGTLDNFIFISFVGTVNAGVQMCVDGSTGTKRLVCRGRSQTADSGQLKTATSNLSTGQWWSVGGAWDIGGDTITPYVAGVAEGGGSVTFGATTYTYGSPTRDDAIGGPDLTSITTASQFDGRIAELAVWVFGASDAGLVAADFLSLSKGFSSRMVRSDALCFYMPLLGNSSPEQDAISRKTGTISGTVAKAEHPRLFLPSRSRRLLPVAVAGSPYHYYLNQVAAIGGGQ